MAAEDCLHGCADRLCRRFRAVHCSPFAGHQIGDAGAEALACVLPCSGLKTIDLEGAALPVLDSLALISRRLLVACRQPNRSCGRGGAGARTAAESDDAPSQRYVRLGLVLRPLLVLAWAAWRVARGAVCRACNRVAAGRLGAGECAHRVRGVSIGGCGARGLQGTESEMRAWRRWRAHCRRV